MRYTDEASIAETPGNRCLYQTNKLRVMKAVFTKVNELQFVVNEKESRYAMGYKAVVTIKVGNAVKEISIYKDSNNGTGETCVGDSSLEDIKAVGMEFDFSDLIKEYDEKLIAILADKDRLKKEKYAKNWEASWIHKKDVKGLQSTLGVTIEVETQEAYVERKLNKTGYNQEFLFVSILYKDHKVGVVYKDVSDVSGSPFRYSNHNANMSFQISCGLTDNKARNYKKFSTVVEKIVKLADESEELNKARKDSVLREKAARQEKLSTLISEFCADKSLTAIAENEWKSGFGSRGGYHVCNFYLVKEENGTKRKLGISFHHTEDEHKTFTFAGLGVLTSTQIRQILPIL